MVASSADYYFILDIISLKSYRNLSEKKFPIATEKLLSKVMALFIALPISLSSNY